ncbi:MAG: hypothetical protein LBH79_03125 [Nitrososphaerota archaeon]|nr:hypothetical protein [Nitrososphaerota archaeon]
MEDKNSQEEWLNQAQVIIREVINDLNGCIASSGKITATTTGTTVLAAGETH